MGLIEVHHRLNASSDGYIDKSYIILSIIRWVL